MGILNICNVKHKKGKKVELFKILNLVVTNFHKCKNWRSWKKVHKMYSIHWLNNSGLMKAQNQ
jgi:hypothetical protein